MQSSNTELIHLSSIDTQHKSSKPIDCSSSTNSNPSSHESNVSSSKSTSSKNVQNTNSSSNNCSSTKTIIHRNTDNQHTNSSTDKFYDIVNNTTQSSVTPHNNDETFSTLRQSIIKLSSESNQLSSCTTPHYSLLKMHLDIMETLTSIKNDNLLKPNFCLTNDQLELLRNKFHDLFSFLISNLQTLINDTDESKYNYIKENIHPLLEKVIVVKMKSEDSLDLSTLTSISKEIAILFTEFMKHYKHISNN